MILILLKPLIYKEFRNSGRIDITLKTLAVKTLKTLKTFAFRDSSCNTHLLTNIPSGKVIKKFNSLSRRMECIFFIGKKKIFPNS